MSVRAAGLYEFHAMTDWTPIATVSECPAGTSIERVVNNHVVALANTNGHYHAIDGLCPHQGGPLGKGFLCGTVLTCPWHGWQFDVVSGRHKLSPTVSQKVYEVCEQNGILSIRYSDTHSALSDAKGPKE